MIELAQTFGALLVIGIAIWIGGQVVISWLTDRLDPDR